AKAVQDNYYAPLKTKREDVKKKRIEVSGKQGYEMRFHLTFVDPPDGFDAKAESVYVAVIDNEPKPAGVYMTIPDNKPDLKPAVDHVVASLQVGSCTLRAGPIGYAHERPARVGRLRDDRPRPRA